MAKEAESGGGKWRPLNAKDVLTEFGFSHILAGLEERVREGVPWHPCDDCIDIVAEIYEQCPDKVLPVSTDPRDPPSRVRSLGLYDIDKVLTFINAGTTDTCERFLDREISQDYARVFRKYVDAPLAELRKWEKEINDRGYPSSGHLILARHELVALAANSGNRLPDEDVRRLTRIERDFEAIYPLLWADVDLLFDVSSEGLRDLSRYVRARLKKAQGTGPKQHPDPETHKQSHHPTAKMVAGTFGVTPRAVRNWAKAGKLRGRKDPDTGEWYFEMEDIAKFQQQNPKYRGRSTPVHRRDISDEDARQLKADWDTPHSE